MNSQTSVKTNIEVLHPFDRSFLMKRRSSGADFLQKIRYQPGNYFYLIGFYIQLYLDNMEW